MNLKGSDPNGTYLSQVVLIYSVRLRTKHSEISVAVMQRRGCESILVLPVLQQRHH